MISNNYLYFTTRFSDISLSPYYDIYLKVTLGSNEIISYNVREMTNFDLFDNHIIDCFSDYIQINYSWNYAFCAMGSDANGFIPVNFSFKVYNKTTNSLCLTKNYDITYYFSYFANNDISSANSNNQTVISGGSYSSSSGNTGNLDSSNDSNFIGNNLGTYSNSFNSIFTGNWVDNIANAVSYVIDFFKSLPDIFNFIMYFFSCLPNWLIAPFVMGITLFIVISVIKFVRG